MKKTKRHPLVEKEILLEPLPTLQGVSNKSPLDSIKCIAMLTEKEVIKGHLPKPVFNFAIRVSNLYINYLLPRSKFESSIDYLQLYKSAELNKLEDKKRRIYFEVAEHKTRSLELYVKKLNRMYKSCLREDLTTLRDQINTFIFNPNELPKGFSERVAVLIGIDHTWLKESWVVLLLRQMALSSNSNFFILLGKEINNKKIKLNKNKSNSISYLRLKKYIISHAKFGKVLPKQLRYVKNLKMSSDSLDQFIALVQLDGYDISASLIKKALGELGFTSQPIKIDQ